MIEKNPNPMSLEEFLKSFEKCEVIRSAIESCGSLNEKLMILCMILDTIAYTENISHDQLYILIDDLKPIIGEVNKNMGKEGIIDDHGNGDM